MYKNILVFGLIFLLIVSAVTPITYGHNAKTFDLVQKIENRDILLARVSQVESTKLSNGPMDSPWPMQGHDARHTGRSPYITADNPGFEKYWFKCDFFVQGSGVIDNDGIIYFASYLNFYAIYPDGSLKWSYDLEGKVRSSPAIDENGIIYIGVESGHADYRFYALYPNGTLKWGRPGSDIVSSPAIAEDGTIIYADSDNWNIIALYPNGTQKWSFHTNHIVNSDPAIFDDTVYCGSHDGNLYALHLSNGTLKWKYQTGDWVPKGPSVANDGTIYFGSWDGHLYACYPDGSLKWKTSVSAQSTPVIAEDGTIYVGGDYLSAVYPNNGSIKWTYNVPSSIHGSTPCTSADGTIFCGTRDPGYIVAVNPDGTERWKCYIGECLFDPFIGEDGTVYIGSSNREYHGAGYTLTGFLHFFGPLDPNAPSGPEINGPASGKLNKKIDYTFKSTSPFGRELYYYIDWGDDRNTNWIGPYDSGEEVTLSHSWDNDEVFIIRAKVKDTSDLWGPWSEFSVSITPRNRAISNALLMRFLEKFPLLEKLISILR